MTPPMGEAPHPLSEAVQKGIGEQLEARLASPKAVIEAVAVREKAAEGDAKALHEQLQKTLQSIATLEFRHLNSTLPIVVPEEEGVRKARLANIVATIGRTLQDVAAVELNGAGTEVTVRLLERPTPIRAGMEVTDRRLEAVNKGRTELRLEINRALEGTPEQLRRAMIASIDSLSEAQLRALPGLLTKLNTVPAPMRLTVLRFAVSVDLNALPPLPPLGAGKEAMEKATKERGASIEKAVGAFGFQPDQEALRKAVTAFVRSLSADESSALGVLGQGIAAVEREMTAEATLASPDAKRLIESYTKMAPGQSRLIHRAILQMRGIEVDDSVDPPQFRACTREEYAACVFMGLLSFLAALGTSEEQAKKETARVIPPSPLERAAAGAGSDGAKLVMSARPAGNPPEVRSAAAVEGPGTSPGTTADTYFFQKPGAAAGTGVEFAFFGNQWQWRNTGRYWFNVRDDAMLEGGVSKAEQDFNKTLNAVAISLRSQNDRVNKELTSVVEAQVKAINTGPLRARGMQLTAVRSPMSAHPRFDITITPVGGPNFEVSPPARTAVEIFGVANVTFVPPASADHRYTRAEVKNLSSDQIAALAEALQRRPA